jgi:hypothetical protein
MNSCEPNIAPVDNRTIPGGIGLNLSTKNKEMKNREKKKGILTEKKREKKREN